MAKRNRRDYPLRALICVGPGGLGLLMATNDANLQADAKVCAYTDDLDIEHPSTPGVYLWFGRMVDPDTHNGVLFQGWTERLLTANKLLLWLGIKVSR